MRGFEASQGTGERRRLRELIEARYENTLGREEFRELEHYLRNDDKAVEEYLDQAALWAELSFLAKKEPVEEQTELRQKRRLSYFSPTIISLSAAIAAGIVALVYSASQNTQEKENENQVGGATFLHATLLSGPEAVCRSGNFKMGSRLPPETLHLSAGMAAIRMDGGASLVVEGPSIFSINKPNELFLQEGKVLVRLRDDGDISIQTPHATVRDLGTEFGIMASAGEDSESQFDVFEGEVEIISRVDARTKRTFEAGEGGKIAGKRKLEKYESSVAPYVNLTSFAPQICLASSKVAKKKNLSGSKTGYTEGILVEKGNSREIGFWLDVRPDGGKDVGEIVVPDKLSEEFHELVSHNRVKVIWKKTSREKHPVATSIKLVRPAENKGTVEGLVVAKSDNEWIEIKPAEGTMRRYVPRWLGGPPNQGGGLDQEAKDLIRQAEIGSTVQAKWIWDERIRLVSLRKIR